MIEGGPGPRGDEVFKKDSDTDTDSEKSPINARRLPLVPLRSAAPESAPPPPAPVESRQSSLASFFEQQRRSEEARRIAEQSEQAARIDDEDDDEQPASNRQPSAGQGANGRSNAELAAVQDVDDGNVLERTEESIVASSDYLRELNDEVSAQSEQLAAAESEAAVAAAEEPAIDLEQIQQEADAYADTLLTEQATEQPEGEVGMAPDDNFDQLLMPTDDLEIEDDETVPTAVPTGSRTRPVVTGPAPAIPPPLVPFPLRGAGAPASSGRPASQGLPAAAVGAVPAAPGVVGGNIPPVGPMSPNSMGPGFGGPNPNAIPFANPNAYTPQALTIAGNRSPNQIDHSHEHWHPKTVLALGAAIVVSHILGRRHADAGDTRLRGRMDEFKAAIDQSNQRLELQQQKLRAEAARVQESYEVSRQKLAQRIDAVENRPTQPDNRLEIAVTPGVARGSVETGVVERPIASRTERSGVQEAPLFDRRSAQLPGAERSGVFAINRDPATVSQAQEAMRAPARVAPEIIPDTDRFAELQARPDLVMEQVAHAAEVGVSTERVYERRQEVRDEPGAGGSQQGGGAASVGSILAQSPYQPQQAVSRQMADTQAQLASGQPYQTDTGMYRQAMTAGFWAGIVIIVFAIMASFAL